MWALTSRRPLPGAESRRGQWTVTWSRCAVMGVVNVTPDSFSDGGLFFGADAAIAQARGLVADGAMVVDVGGESTRPGSEPIGTAAELDRILPVIRALVDDGRALVSVDTRHAEVADAAVAAGAHIVNDIAGLRDPDMIAVCARWGVPTVVMHMQGDPTTMQIDPRYGDVVAEVATYLQAQGAKALEAGIPAVLLDPGIGFGKTFDHNMALLDGLPLIADSPVLVGASRKRFIGQLTGRDLPAERDAGSVAVHLHAARRGVAMVRVHDVRSHVDALTVQAALGA